MTKDTYMNHMTDALAVSEFLLAGRARFTLVSKVTGVRYTYRVSRHKEKHDLYFVSYLSGQSNETSFTFVGSFRRDDMLYTHSRRTSVAWNAPAVIAISWFLSRIRTGQLPVNAEFWHEGRCGRCGRALTVPESIKRGIGPECADIMHLPELSKDPMDEVPRQEALL